jgi:hypothetical protein
VIRLLWIVALFCIDIRVKADAEVYAGRSQKTFGGAGAHVILEPGSLLENREGEAIHLVKGHFFVELKDAALVKTPFATMACAAQACQALIRRSENSVSVKALKGEFMVRRLGDKQHYSLMAGAQIAVSAVTDRGVSDMDFPQALPWDSTVKEWSKFFPGTMKEFKPALVQFREDWKQAVEKLSGLHQTYAARTIASHEQAVAAELARRAAEERENAKFRQLFREKTLGP